MARNFGTSVENNFTKGLITEVTGVNSPENSVTESLDVIYDRRGRASSRPGYKREDGGIDLDVSSQLLSGTARSEFLWEAVGGFGGRSYIVLQIGTLINFFEAVTGPLSGGYKPFSVELLSYKVPVFSNSAVGNTQAAFTSGKGSLFIVHPMCEPILIKYNADTDTISASQINIVIRDLQGVSDGLPVDTRPPGLSTEHNYNLFNQGWYALGPVGNEAENTVPVLAYWASERDDYPSHSDVWWYFLTPADNGLETLSRNPGDFNTNVNNKKDLYGNTPAPRGHCLIEAFDTNRSASTGIPGVPEESSGGYRPSVVAFYAGRAFYAGVQSSNYSSTVYFTQIIERDEQLGSCYQVNDPTSREQFDLLDSDGGTIKIQDIGAIIDLKVVGNSLVIFATNGVWALSGTDTSPFKATDYSVTKITSFPALSKSSIVSVGGTPIWWNYEGIFSLQKDAVGLVNDVVSLTNTTIKTFYDEEVPHDSKVYAKGSFNDQEGLVYWLYRSDPNGSPTDYDRILVLDSVTTAFYPLTLPNADEEISGVLSIRGSTIPKVESQVVTASDTVVTSLGDTIYVLEDGTPVSTDKIFKFVRIIGNNLSFVEMTASDSLDYGVYSFSPVFVTGYRIRGNLMNRFQTNYLTVITEDSGSCFVQGIWDYSNSPNSCRYTNPQQVYRNRSFRDYQISKVKIRGNGRSLQFRFFGESGKSFVVVGWAGFESANTVP